MAFKTYGAGDAPDLVSESSVLAGKLDASEQSDGTIRLAQAFAGSFDVGSYAQGPSSTPTPRQIHHVATPTADTDAATKGYVDGAASPLTFHIEHNTISGVSAGTITPGRFVTVSFEDHITVPEGFNKDNGTIIFQGVTFLDEGISGANSLIVASYAISRYPASGSLSASLVLYNATDKIFSGSATLMNIFYDLLWFT